MPTDESEDVQEIERRADWTLRDDGRLEVVDELGRRFETVDPVVEPEEEEQP